MKKLDQQTEIIKKRYNRTSRFYDYMDFMIKDATRQQVLSLARGRVLEVGVGTGKNLPFYPADCGVTGIDFSLGMLEKARARAENLHLEITLQEMDAQQMTFPDATFDTVVATCVFCSVPDPVKGLKEIKRVCKPGGQVILLEHVRSENPVLGVLMDLLNPVSLHLVGSNINRRTVENVRKSGLQTREVRNMGHSKLVKLIIASPGDKNDGIN